ncbi:M57 family metalloprotease [Aquimarina sp. Aq78]|uniref:M57 family metalloprotease n=1 Tax=Aquimarina sp. Aq78 TaxID=1191889 RepID=UPI0020C254C2|nr:M57 family metalloprotease [Aquimarina sp. Aq78]
MKKLNFILIIVCILSLGSCTKEELPENLNQTQNTESDKGILSDPEKKEILIAMGFQKDKIEGHKDYFLIDDDLIIYKSAISKELINPLAPVNISKQLRNSFFVSDNIVTNIRVRIDPNFNSNWNSLIQQALTAWNNAGSMVSFTVVTTSPHITIYSDTSLACPVSHRNLSSNVCGRGTFPPNGNPGNVISINTDSPHINTNAKRLRTITHEFGHNVGLMHTNQGSGGIHIPGTPNTDPASLMNGGECGQVKPLSPNDILAIRIMYSEATWTRAGVDFSKGGWHIGDYNGDGKDDIFRYRPGISGADVFLSNGVDFIYSGNWTGAGVDFSKGGWHIGDYNGDGKDDIFRYRPGISGAEVFLSTGSSFTNNGSWTGAGVDFSKGGWHIGDYNGDGKDDIFRYRPGISGAEVFLSTGSSFTNNGSWTGAGVDFSKGGWHIGDYNGDGKDDIFRYRPGISGAEVFLSTGSSFTNNGSWTGAGVDFSKGGWHIGDYNGDGKDDIFRYRPGISGAEVFLSTGSSFSNNGSWTGAGVDFSKGGWHIGDYNGDGDTDIFRYIPTIAGADVFISTGSSFSH